MSNQHFITKNGLSKINAQIAEFEEKRLSIIQKIDEARKLGDLSENAEYRAAREDQKVNDKKLSDISSIKANCTVITKEMIGNEGVIKIGAQIELTPVEKGQKKIITIVSNIESDVPNNLISVETPIAQKLIGKEIDDEILIGSQKYVITKISYDHL